jgi:integrase
VLRRLEAPARGYYLVYDKQVHRLALAVYSTGKKVWKFIYTIRGVTKWLTIGDTEDFPVKAARKIAHQRGGQVAVGRDPQAEHMEELKADTFEILAKRFFKEHAQKRNKEWRQTEYCVRAYVPKRFCDMSVTTITRKHVKEVVGNIDKPFMANKVLAAISSVFNFGVRQDVLQTNPCQLVERQPTASRERVLSDQEMPKFWKAFDEFGPITGSALKVLLLTGQRPGEVAHMRREHIKGQWWEMPGLPVPQLKWPGTKNDISHRVWLVKEVMRLIEADATSGFVFAKCPEQLKKAMQRGMKKICQDLGVERATPHDLRRHRHRARLWQGRDEPHPKPQGGWHRRCL